VGRKKENTFINDLIEFLLAAGLFYVLYSYFFEDKNTRKSTVPGIHGIPDRVHFFRAFKDNKTEPYRKELSSLSNDNIKRAIDLVIKASKAIELKGNWIKFFENDTITGELKSGQIRILFYRLDKTNFELLTIFLKKDEETDINYKQKARERIKRINSRT